MLAAKSAPSSITCEEQLEDLLSEPTEPVVETLRRLDGDILFLGAGGKIGPSISRMARRASDLAGVARRVIGVSRFSSAGEEDRLRSWGIETIRCDLLDEAAVDRLPDAPNVVYLAGMKFGSTGQESKTWAMNSYLPAVVCKRYRTSRIVAYSTGAVYGWTPVAGGGSREEDEPQPAGEYAMSCLGRERIFEHFSRTLGIPVALIRLFYACELRYGVLVDLAWKVLNGEPIDVSMGWFNVIWQGDQNAMTLRAFDHLASPPFVLNVTGQEALRIRDVAEALGRELGRPPRLVGAEQATACLGNAGEAHRLFGPPRVAAEPLTRWVAEWVRRGGPCLGKPTHFEARDGKY